MKNRNHNKDRFQPLLDMAPDTLLPSMTNEEIRKALSFMAETFTGYPEIERIYDNMKKQLGEAWPEG